MKDKYQLYIEGELPNLNDVIKASKTHWSNYSTEKETFTLLVTSEARKQLKGVNLNSSVNITMIWIVKDKKKDPDNIAFAKKYILDGLTTAGVLKNDNLNHVVSFNDQFCLEKNSDFKVGVFVIITPMIHTIDDITLKKNEE